MPRSLYTLPGPFFPGVLFFSRRAPGPHGLDPTGDPFLAVNRPPLLVCSNFAFSYKFAQRRRGNHPQPPPTPTRSHPISPNPPSIYIVYYQSRDRDLVLLSILLPPLILHEKSLLESLRTPSSRGFHARKIPESFPGGNLNER